jgi:pimeloyl-ACP methyl ester carboxylesterase
LTQQQQRWKNQAATTTTTTTHPVSVFSSRFFSSTATSSMEDLTFTKPDTTGIAEQACIDAANKMKRLAVPVSSDVSPSGSVGISYIHWPAATTTRKKAPPLFLLHGFDSSGLEYRRLGPQLASRGIDAYAVDILGWGFTQLSDVSSFSANSKVEALKSFVQTLLGPSTPFVIAGASLGGAAAIELAAALSNIDDDDDDDNFKTSSSSSSSPPPCVGLILIDAQGFVDGVGPMASLPKPLAKIGVGVLQSVPLRNMANKMSYYDVETYATEEAQVIGRLHCLRDGWSDAMVSFMQSGGFSPSSKISKINSPALVLWGRQDGILDGEEFANKVRCVVIYTYVLDLADVCIMSLKFVKSNLVLYYSYIK